MDSVNHPEHYNVHPSWVECIDLAEWMTFCSGNALKYVWRCNAKGRTREDLQKALWYVNREAEHPYITRAVVPDDVMLAAEKVVKAEPSHRIKLIYQLLLTLTLSLMPKADLREVAQLLQEEI